MNHVVNYLSAAFYLVELHTLNYAAPPEGRADLMDGGGVTNVSAQHLEVELGARSAARFGAGLEGSARLWPGLVDSARHALRWRASQGSADLPHEAVIFAGVANRVSRQARPSRSGTSCARTLRDMRPMSAAVQSAQPASSS